MLETPLGTLAPETREIFHFPIYIIVIAITVCCCISMVPIAVCVMKSTLARRRAKSEVSISISRVNNEIAEPVYAAISDNGDSIGEMQVEMTMWHTKVFTL